MITQQLSITYEGNQKYKFSVFPIGDTSTATPEEKHMFVLLRAIIHNGIAEHIQDPNGAEGIGNGKTMAEADTKADIDYDIHRSGL